MTNTMRNTYANSSAIRPGIPVDEIIAAARALAKAGRSSHAMSLLDAAATPHGQARALLAVAAAEVAIEGEWFTGAGEAIGRLRAAEQVCATVDLDPGTRWDLAFLRLRYRYFNQVFEGDRFRPGSEGKDPDVIAGLKRDTEDLRTQAPDDVRRGWADMYLGLIADNLRGERDAAPAHYEAALRAGESGDDLLAREALRHLGDHDHDRGDHVLALERWSRATALGARAGAVLGTLSQQMLLAVLAREAGDDAGAAALAREIARWAGALGAIRLEAQATGFLAGNDPTAAPDHDS